MCVSLGPEGSPFQTFLPSHPVLAARVVLGVEMAVRQAARDGRVDEEGVGDANGREARRRIRDIRAIVCS